MLGRRVFQASIGILIVDEDHDGQTNLTCYRSRSTFG